MRRRWKTFKNIQIVQQTITGMNNAKLEDRRDLLLIGLLENTMKKVK